jgi:hypothetical protein
LATACAILIAVLACWAFWTAATRPLNLDFVSFWSAGRLVVEGMPNAAYDVAAHHRAEMQIVPGIGTLPFPYPPPFLALMAPFALLPFAAAFVLWVLLTGTIYAAAARRLTAWPYVLANPTILVDAMIGQTGLLAGGLLIAGAVISAEAPFTGGVLLGLMIFKPQLAVMLPVALLAARQWSSIAGAAVSAIALLLLGLVLFGPTAYAGFFQMLLRYSGYLRNARWNWTELASPFAFCRYFGIGVGLSLALQLVIALSAASLTGIAWWRDWETKIPVLACATLLGSPYLFTYDAVLMIVPAAYMLEQRRFWLVGLLWLMCALPVAHVFGLYDGPNTICFAAACSAGLLGTSPFREPTERLIPSTLRLRRE